MGREEVITLGILGTLVISSFRPVRMVQPGGHSKLKTLNSYFSSILLKIIYTNDKDHRFENCKIIFLLSHCFYQQCYQVVKYLKIDICQVIKTKR